MTDPLPKSDTHDPVRWDATARVPASPVPGRGAFIELCESLRFRLDQVVEMDARARLKAREQFRDDRGEFLGTALRVDEINAPRIAALLKRCADRLRRSELPETFITTREGEHNAFSLSVAPNDLQLLGFSGRLFEMLDESEMLGVMGHEMGHQALHAFACRRKASGLGPLEARIASQQCEISADRVGMLACGDVRHMASSLIKIHTMLPSSWFNVEFGNLLSQASEIPATWNEWQVVPGHPFLSFRLWALWKFSESDLYRDLAGQGGGKPFESVEAEICERFETLGGGLLLTMRSRPVVPALTWLGCLLFAEIADPSEKARDAFARALGAVEHAHAMEILRRCGIAEVRARARSAVESAVEADSNNFERIERLLLDLSRGLDVNLRACEAWVILAETRRQIGDPDA